MSLGSILYTLFIGPLQLLFEVIFVLANRIANNPGISIFVLSLTMNFMVLPLYKRADAMQEEERAIQTRLQKGVRHIKKTFHGDEKMMMLQTYYRQNGYKPSNAIKGSVSLLLEIPFFVAAYQFLSNLDVLWGASLGPISDLGQADDLIRIGTLTIHLLPIVMTTINLISCAIYTKGLPLKTKIQLYFMAFFFFVFLYESPSGLVLYWTLNNIFSLVKTLFYKLKNPHRVFRWMLCLAGSCLVLFGTFLFETDHFKQKLFVIALGMLLCFISFFYNKRKFGQIKCIANDKQNSALFWLGAVYLTILTGLLIPSAVIQSSPQEFVDVYYFVHPVWYICSAMLLAAGFFIIWLGVFKWLFGKEKNTVFCLSIWLINGIATVDYMCFGKNLGILGSNLQYEKGMSFSPKEIIGNGACIIALCAIMLLVFVKFRTAVTRFMVVACISVAVMSVANIHGICESISRIETVSEQDQQEELNFQLSKSGKNVIVFMLDRGINEFLPYIFQEKPELKEIYSGFTYYANTVSFGAYTNYGTPALYGGYEYTPVEMNARDDETMVSKQNEALMVLPVLFSQNGYDVTVCDPTYANYEYIPDTSIYDQYPDIHAFNTNGRFLTPETREQRNKGKMRNFFCYSITKQAPLFAQSILYYYGTYNSSENNADKRASTSQVMVNPYKASGINDSFLNAYTVLTNLCNMTELTEKNVNTFLMISNDTTHEVTMLQEPDYEVSEYVDNTMYEEEHAERFTVDGKTLQMTSDFQYGHYQINMAALLEIGEWITYMKENDVYDNTRIIIAADHGNALESMESMILDSENRLYDLESYYPLLMVKDFNDTEFSISEEFMTNGDVPTLATENLIENAQNPFTGKMINNAEKYEHDQYILGSNHWEVDDKTTTTYNPGIWFSVHDDMRDIRNWTVLQEYSLSPFVQIEGK